MSTTPNWQILRPLGPIIDTRPACDRCGEKMDSVHCKLICPNCGLTRDCSDP